MTPRIVLLLLLGRVRACIPMLGALAALFVGWPLGFTGALSQPADGGDFKVPSFVGMAADTALLALLDLGVAYQFVDNDVCPPEIRTVVYQLPEAGATVKKTEVKIVLFTQKATTVPDLSTEIPKILDAPPEQVSDKLKAKGFAAEIQNKHIDVKGQCAEATGWRKWFIGLSPAVGAPVCENGRIIVMAETIATGVVIKGKCDAKGKNCKCF